MPKFDLEFYEQHARDNFVSAVLELMLDHDAEAVGRIADNVGEYGIGDDGGPEEDAVIVACLRIIIDAMADAALKEMR